MFIFDPMLYLPLLLMIVCRFFNSQNDEGVVKRRTRKKILKTQPDIFPYDKIGDLPVGVEFVGEIEGRNNIES